MHKEPQFESVEKDGEWARGKKNVPDRQDEGEREGGEQGSVKKMNTA